MGGRPVRRQLEVQVFSLEEPVHEGQDLDDQLILPQVIASLVDQHVPLCLCAEFAGPSSAVLAPSQLCSTHVTELGQLQFTLTGTAVDQSFLAAESFIKAAGKACSAFVLVTETMRRLFEASKGFTESRVTFPAFHKNNIAGTESSCQLEKGFRFHGDRCPAHVEVHSHMLQQTGGCDLCTRKL